MNSPWIHGVKAVRLVVYIELLFLALISDCLESPSLPRIWTGLMCMYVIKTVQIQVHYGGDIICHSGFLTMMVQSRYWRWVQVVEIATWVNHPNVFPIKFCFPNLALPDSIPFFWLISGWTANPCLIFVSFMLWQVAIGFDVLGLSRKETSSTLKRLNRMEKSSRLSSLTLMVCLIAHCFVYKNKWSNP